MSQKVLITAKVHEYLINQLESKGYTVHYQPSITYDGVMQAIHDVKGMIVTTRIKVDKAMIDRAAELQWIGRLGSGMELIDVPYAESKGIHCASSPEGNMDTVGEQAVGMLIMLQHNLLRSNLQLREGIWERDGNRAWELGGKTIGIIGYGHTGSAFARKLRGFDMRILAYDKYKKGYGNDLVTETDMDTIFREADVVSLHLPLTEETRHLGNTAFFSSFAKPVCLMNTSRGKVVSTADLVAALESGKIAGACLDVLENEKLETFSETEKEQFRYLLQNDRVILTPHIAGYSHEASIKMAQIVLKKLNV
ncbi:NAD(P)-dependent oxidoreductase [Chitinophaga niabensis]|uniref:D-3-phosphoglycerate dehydrogenase n=1 Tax=Chitinophaga niabensis TaxID=536979 RepID=A0A1N6J8F6_9BACT|nr:NAD(P)-dependent oxidoreductase [Chitinophaga niabensis]SIO40439.1 D-3-phosphoglycerate dehydrogenase [Chitinophaga niabensis]